MNELNERVQNAEARATEAERQAQATQQELVRSLAGVKGKVKGAAVPLQQEQGIDVCVEVPASARSKVRTTSGQLVWTMFLVVRWQKSTTVTIQQTSSTWRSRH